MSYLNNLDMDDITTRAAKKQFLKQVGFLETKQELSSRHAELFTQLRAASGKPKEEFLQAVGGALTSLTDDIIDARSSDKVIVGEEHAHLKKDTNSITTADVAWSSRAILNNIIPVLKTRVRHYPESSQPSACLERCQKIKKQASVDVYEYVNLMEEASRLVTVPQSQQSANEACYLSRINDDLKTFTVRYLTFKVITALFKAPKVSPSITSLRNLIPLEP